ncbi:MAG: sialidase family protein [Acidobacteria bacterium]|nr:sialidase family protein [Acidobacteriota bacterium]MDA1235402.1 sialidase family protein [Acidobacteriota bacterium]
MRVLAFYISVFLIGCSHSNETAPTAAAGLEQFTVFEAGTHGYAHYRIPAIVVSPKGTLMAFAEARKNTSGDWGPIDLVMRRSKDSGESWDEQRVIAQVEGEIQQNPVAFAQGLAKPGEVTYNNLAPIVDHEHGLVHFLFAVEYARIYYMRSDDDGETFSTPVDVTAAFESFRPEYDWKVVATGPGHGIRLDNGRLLVPIWMSNGTGGHAHRPSAVATIYSDDNGGSWQRGDIVVQHPELVNPSETLAIQLADGRVMLNIRHESPSHRRAISVSADGATGWSEIRLQPELLEPVCMGSLIRLSTAEDSDKNRMIFVNPDTDEPRDSANPDGNRVRQNVTVQLSYDEGQTWTVKKVLEPGLSSYSDLAVGPGGEIYCLYERGQVEADRYYTSRVTLARFDLEWLTDGADSLKR